MGDRGLEGGDGIFGTGFSSSIEGGTGGLMTLKPTEINKLTMEKNRQNNAHQIIHNLRWRLHDAFYHYDCSLFINIKET